MTWQNSSKYTISKLSPSSGASLTIATSEPQHQRSSARRLPEVRHEGSPGGVCPCHFPLVTRVGALITTVGGVHASRIALYVNSIAALQVPVRLVV